MLIMIGTWQQKIKRFKKEFLNCGGGVLVVEVLILVHPCY